MQNYFQQIIENAHNYPQPKLTWSCVGQKIASKVVVSAAAISFPFRQFPAFHQHRLRIHLPGRFKGTHRCCASGLDEGLCCHGPGRSALEMLLGSVGRTGSQGSWNPAESVKDGAAHLSTSVGCQTSKQADVVSQKWFSSVHGTFCMLLYKHSSIATCLYILLSQCWYSAPNKS